MKKILVIDDEKPTRELIKHMIDSFHLPVEVYTDGENVQSGIDAIKKISPDLVILDIQMPDGNGFDVLKALPEKNFEVIFITAFQEFAIQAIKFSALDYLLKPVDPDELHESIENAINLIKQQQNQTQFSTLQNNLNPGAKKKLVLKTQESIHVVEIEDIIRCEADKNYTFFYLVNNKKILVSKTLKDYDTMLSGFTFFRAQQSHLINMDFVERYDKHDGGSIIMKDGSSVPLSPAKKDMFFQLLEAM